MDFFTKNIIIGMLFFILGHTLGWYTHNLQFVYEYWKDKIILSNIIFGVPAGIFFWVGTKYIFIDSGELWTARFLAAVMSYVTFPLMTWYYLGESMFTLKTMLCVILAMLILIVQIVLK